MDKLWAMEVFVRVAEAKSFSRAADSLDLANATVSSCVRNLEQHLGVTLINRDTRRLSLTEEGLRMLPRAKDLLEAVGRLESEVRSSPSRLRGALHVEVPISIGNMRVCPALPEFARRYPDIEVSMVLTNRPRHMIEQAIDVAIRMEHVEDDDLIARPLFESRYVMVCAPTVAAALPSHPVALTPEQCVGVISEERWKANPWILERRRERVELRPHGHLNLNSSDAVVRAAASGLGVAMLLDVFARESIDSGALVRVYGDWEMPRRQFYLVTVRSSVGSARVRAFSSFMLELFGTPADADHELAVAVRPGRR